jgi:Domain of unknown function (DUF6647)
MEGTMRNQIFLAMLITSLIGPWSAHAQEPRDFSLTATQIVELPGTVHAIVFNSPSLQVGEPRDMQALTLAIEAWLASNFGLPEMKANPRIEYISATEADGQKYARLLTLESMLNNRAAYLPRWKAIYLPAGWNGGTPAELSVFVRQLAGLLRNEAGGRYRCMPDDDTFALTVQIRWLAMFGADGSNADVKRRQAASPHCTLRLSEAGQ